MKTDLSDYSPQALEKALQVKNLRAKRTKLQLEMIQYVRDNNPWIVEEFERANRELLDAEHELKRLELC
jgi:hypothetical protein